MGHVPAKVQMKFKEQMTKFIKERIFDIEPFWLI
jgi:hypothetical protein